MKNYPGVDSKLIQAAPRRLVPHGVWRLLVYTLSDPGTFNNETRFSAATFFLVLLFATACGKPEHDFIIPGGTVYDASSGPAMTADPAIDGEQVIRKGEHTGATQGKFVKGPGWTGNTPDMNP